MDTTNCVTNLINHYPDWEGAKVLQLLTQHPDTDIYATVVELCLSSTIPPLEAQNLRYLARFRGIEKVESQALMTAIAPNIKEMVMIVARSKRKTGGDGDSGLISSFLNLVQAIWAQYSAFIGSFSHIYGHIPKNLLAT